MSNIIKSEIQVKNLELFYGENNGLTNYRNSNKIKYVN